MHRLSNGNISFPLGRRASKDFRGLTAIGQFGFHDGRALLVVIQEDVVGFDILLQFELAKASSDGSVGDSLSPVWIIPFTCSESKAVRMLRAIVLILRLEMGAFVADLNASSCKCSNTKQGGSST